VIHQKLKRQQTGPISFHDNARPQIASTTVQKLHLLGIEDLPNPSYTPDSSPTDFHFSCSFDNFLRQN
ncbi:Histone-lysine N-methyltransferase SETMAR, partial [Habropoda laboriosa]